MTIGGAFLGGGVELVPAGSCKLVLEIRTEDGRNLATTFSVVGGGQTYTATAGSDGRAELIVPSGVTYTVTTSATGYDGLTAQTVTGDSATIQYVRFEATLPRVKKSGDTMTGSLTIQRASTPSIGVRATEGSYGDVLFYDSGSNRSAFVRGEHTSDYNRLVLGCSNPNGNTINYTMQLFNHATDGVYMLGQTPSNWADNSDKIATTSWINTASSVVHTISNEEISGQKSYLNPIISNIATGRALTCRFSNYTSGENPSSTIDRTVRFEDKNSKNLGHLIYALHPDGKRHLGLTILRHDGTYNEIGVYIKPDGTFSSVAPSTPSDATGKEIATADWSIGKFVQKSGDTMTGNLTLSWQGPPSVTNVNARITKDFAAFTTVGSFLANATDGVIGGIQVLRSAPLGYAASITNVIANNASGTEKSISLVARDNNEAYATCPTPPSKTENSNQIATTSWINSADVICRTVGNQTINGVKTFTSAYVRQTPQNAGAIPTSHIYIPIITVKGADEQEWGYLRMFITKDTKERKWQWCVNKLNDDGTTSESAFIQLVAKTDEYDAYATAPTTPTNATSDEIATAGWVLGKVPKRTTFSTWAELSTLLTNGKPGDMMCITLDYVGDSNIDGFTASDVSIHAFGNFTVEELAVSSGKLTMLEAFGGGEIQYKSTLNRYFAITGFGQMAVGDTSAWALRVPYGGEMNLMLMMDNKVTSCTGFYVSL